MPMTMTSACTPRARRGNAGTFLGQALAVWRQRQSLRHLDAHALKDIGVSDDAARAEANRPIWDVPGYWLR